MSARGLESPARPSHELASNLAFCTPAPPGSPLPPTAGLHTCCPTPAALPHLHAPAPRQSGLHLGRLLRGPAHHSAGARSTRSSVPSSTALTAMETLLTYCLVCGPPPTRRDTQGSRACLPAPRGARLCVSERSPAKAKLFNTRALTLGHLRGPAPWEALWQPRASPSPHSLRKTGARTEGQELTVPEAAGAAPWPGAGLPGNGAGVILEDLLLPAPSV